MKITERYTTSVDQPIAITDAHYIGDFAIRLTFNDGHRKLVDFKPFLEQSHHPAIKKYLNESQFQGFRIEGGTLDWNDFDICFPIADLYHNTILKEEKAASVV